MFLKTLESNIINKSGNIFQSIGSNGKVSWGLTAEVTHTKVVTNLVQFTLDKNL